MVAYPAPDFNRQNKSKGWVSYYHGTEKMPCSKEKEENTMNDHANKSIEGTVRQCEHHCQNENYCSLDRILVGTHEADPTMDQCTDCKSFHIK